MQALQDKVVLITGGSSGIGRAAALRLASAGARIAVAARNVAALESVAAAIKSGGGQALVVPTDVGDAWQCERAVANTVTHFGQLDILVCSAGLSMRSFFDGSDLAALERVVRVNFLGTMYATHYALPHVKRSRGSLVALSSLTGLRGVPSYSIYGASKCAIKGFYDSLRLELIRDGVHVGILAPGFVDTPLRQHVLGPDGNPWVNPPEPPFRIWPVETCVDRLMDMLIRRRAQVNLPGFVGFLLWIDQIVGCRLGDWIVRWKFPPV
jgi:NAD(P)-dependent dehydrogenase (short-subunit alcohol dehydrogenase family)